MELTALASWLNTFFAGYDYAILGALHTAAQYAGSVLTPLMKVISLLGEKGLLMFLLSLILVLFPRTRKMGICVFGAVCCGALITNIILKDMVARPRPFQSSELYRQWWNFVGAAAEDDFSFPSGHVTAITAGMSALYFTCRRRHKSVLFWGAVVAVLLMAISRNYMVAHYPSDVLFAAAIGLFSAVVAYLITLLIFRILEDHDDLRFCAAILDADIRDLPETLRARREARPVPETDLEEDEEEEAPPAEAAPVTEDTTIAEEAPEPERVPAAVRKKPAVKKGAYVPKH